MIVLAKITHTVGSAEAGTVVHVVNFSAATGQYLIQIGPTEHWVFGASLTFL